MLTFANRMTKTAKSVPQKDTRGNEWQREDTFCNLKTLLGFVAAVSKYLTSLHESCCNVKDKTDNKEYLLECVVLCGVLSILNEFKFLGECPVLHGEHPVHHI